MERLVAGIARINFQQNCEEILLEKRVDKMATWPTAKVSASGDMTDAEFKCNSYSESAEISDEVDDEDFAPGSSTGIAVRCAQRRNMPKRACKENTGLQLKRRSIMKPKRNAAKTSDFSLLRPADIKKIYTNQKLANFRPTNLETIFEEPQAERRSGGAAIATATAAGTATADSNQMRFIGMRKIRRSLSCSDGLNTNKTLTKQRRARIKKVFGRRCTLKKISLTDFLERLNKSLGDETSFEPSALDEPMDADAGTTANTKTTLERPEDGAAKRLATADDQLADDETVYKSKSFSGICFAAGRTETATVVNVNCMGGITLS